MARGAEILITWVSESRKAVSDMRKVERTLGDTADKTDRHARRMATAHKVVNGALTAWVGTLGVAAYAYGDMVKSAQEDAAAQAKLEVVARNAAKATDTQVAAMNDYIDSVAAATTYTDDQLRPAMANLLSVVQDTTKSQDLLSIAMDASAASGKPVESVATAIAKAYDGNATSLKRMFPFLDEATIKSGDFAAIMAELEANTKGAAKAGADKDQWTLFTQNLDELKESLGALANSEGGTQALKDLNRELGRFRNWVDENPDVFNKVVVGIAAITAGLVALKAALSVAGTLEGLGKVIKKFPAAFGVGILVAEIVALYQALKDVDDGADGALGSLKRFWSFKDPFNGNWWFTDMLKTAYEWLEKLFAKLNQLLPSWLRINDAALPGSGISGGADAGVSRSAASAPSLLPSSVGRIAAASAQPVTNVFVDGRRAPARVTTGAWQPQLALGVV